MDEKEKLVTCPYDPSHRVKKYRMFRHLTKCEKQYSHLKLEKCPFNTLHRVKPLEMQHHLLTCESRGNAASLLFTSEPARPLDTITVQEVNDIQKNIPVTENWAIESEFARSYNPLEHIKEKNILHSLICASRSEKQRFKEKERERHSSIANNTSTCIIPPKAQVPKLKDELEKPLRLPRCLPQTLMQCKVKNDNNNTGSNSNVLESEKTSENSKYLDEDLTVFQKSTESFEHKNNSISKNDNMIKILNNTNETYEKTTNNLRKLEKSSDQRCSFGRGIAMMRAACNNNGTFTNNFKSNCMNSKGDVKSLIDTTADAQDYTGTFFGYDEEFNLSLKQLEDELENISN